MGNYTQRMTAEQLIAYIANDRPELSHEKVMWQRNHYIKICREWLEASANAENNLPVMSNPGDKDYEV